MKNRISCPSLAGVCGTSIETGDVAFTGEESNLVYMDKVFSRNHDCSCPLIFHLNTGCDPEKFDVKFTTADKGCGCGCNPCSIDKNAVFTVENAFAILDFIQTKPPGDIDPCQVTIDGEEVDSITFVNGRYLINADSLLSKVQNEVCTDVGLPSKRFLLIRNVGPWKIRATYVIEGTVTSGGRTCCFKLEISNADDAPATFLPNTCCANFAIPDLAIPCVTNGIDPEISFHFTGKIKLVNPEVKVDCGRRPMAISAEGPCGCAEFFDPCSLGCTVFLKSKVVVEPCVHVETVRRTLFIINAREGVIPCVEQLAGLQIENGKHKNPCNNLAGIGFKLRDERCQGNFDARDIRGICGDLRGVRDFDCRRRSDVLGIEDICEEDCDAVGGISNNNRHRDVCGCIDFEERGCDDRCGCDRGCGCGCEDVRGVSNNSNRHRDVCSCIDFEKRGCDDRCGCDRGCGCGCEDVRGISDRCNHQARAPFQFNGCNGCSW